MRFKNVSNISPSDSNRIVFGKSLTCSSACAIVRVFGGTARHTSVSSHCKCIAIAVIGMNASSGLA